MFILETDPCSPSPCTYNGECKVRNGIAICIYPECVINSDCPREKACFGQKCKDPCIGACGINSLCQTVNHKPVCSCPIGFTGNARIQCTIPTVEGDLFDFKIFNKKKCFNKLNWNIEFEHMQNQFQNVFTILNARTIRLATTKNASILAHSIPAVSTVVATYNYIELCAYVMKGSLAILNNIVVKVSFLNFDLSNPYHKNEDFIEWIENV